MRAGIIRHLVESSIEYHLLHDNMDHANERARVARVLVQIDRQIVNASEFRDLSVDTEYSVVGPVGDPKRVNGRFRSPDLLIHRRQDSRRNIFVGEVKRRVRSVPRKGPDGLDSKKICRMLLGGLPGIAPYRVGACINLDEAGAVVFWWSSRSADSGTQDMCDLDGPLISALGDPTHGFAGQPEFDWERWDNIDLL